jgi:hypothetical protein
MLPPLVRRLAASLVLIALALTLVAAPGAAATSIVARNQLRGHLPELGEKPALRVFQTQATYDAYRASLGDANVFPAASAMFMSFDKDILALYIRGNDAGGRCFATTTGATLDGDTATLDLAWQNGTCGAPISAHYPFILLSVSRTAADGSSWVTPSRSVCGAAPGVSDSRVCATLSGASPAPTATPAPTAPPTGAPTSAAPTAIPSPTPARTLTPSATATSPVAAASPTPGSTSAQASPVRSPVAAASPPPANADGGTNFLLYGMLIAIGVLIGIALMLSRTSSPRRGR